MTTVRKTTPHASRLVLDNVAFLRQGLNFLASLSDAEYVQDYSPALSDGIGAHIRHIVDHYRCFFTGLEAGCIDYEARDRSSLVSSNRLAAIDAINSAIEQLQELSLQAHALDIYVEEQGAADGLARRRAPSSVDRELQFLISHTVHHYALLAMITRLEGRELMAGFGVSPSTLRYRNTLR